MMQTDKQHDSLRNAVPKCAFYLKKKGRDKKRESVISFRKSQHATGRGGETRKINLNGGVIPQENSSVMLHAQLIK